MPRRSSRRGVTPLSRVIGMSLRSRSVLPTAGRAYRRCYRETFLSCVCSVALRSEVRDVGGLQCLREAAPGGDAGEPLPPPDEAALEPQHPEGPGRRGRRAEAGPGLHFLPQGGEDPEGLTAPGPAPSRTPAAIAAVTKSLAPSIA